MTDNPRLEKVFGDYYPIPSKYEELFMEEPQ